MPVSAKDTNVRRHLAGLVFHDESLDAFIDWFFPALWEIERLGSDEDIDLAWRIENRLAGLSGGCLTEGELLAALRDDAQAFGVLDDAATISSSTSAVAG